MTADNLLSRPKIFGIGFHKTGTSSLQRALEILGYRCCSDVGIYDENITHTARNLAFALIPKFDAFRDNPWPILFKELDAHIPRSKFILTVRDENKWIQSVVNHFGTNVTPMRKWIYGVGFPKGNESIYLDRYRAHNRDVRAYFSNRPGDLLEIDITAAPSREKLCS